MSHGSFNLNIRVLGQKVCPVASVRTDGQIHTKVTTEGTLSGFQKFSFNLSSRIGQKNEGRLLSFLLTSYQCVLFFQLSLRSERERSTVN